MISDGEHDPGSGSSDDQERQSPDYSAMLPNAEPERGPLGDLSARLGFEIATNDYYVLRGEVIEAVRSVDTGTVDEALRGYRAVAERRIDELTDATEVSQQAKIRLRVQIGLMVDEAGMFFEAGDIVGYLHRLMSAKLAAEQGDIPEAAEIGEKLEEFVGTDEFFEAEDRFFDELGG